MSIAAKFEIEYLQYMDPTGKLVGKELPAFAQNGKVTPAGIEELKKRMPHSNFAEFEKDPTVDHMSKLFTVDAIVNFIEGKLK